MEKAIIKIPKLEDILAETPQTQNEDKLTFILNQTPKKEWIKSHPLNTKVKYIPIERIQWLLAYIFGFGGWEFNVVDSKLVANSVCVTGRLIIKHPITGEKLSFDGAGAWALQTEKGASAMDINKLNNNAVMLAFPAAKAEALKNAAKLLGKMFGSDLNRDDEIAYDALLPKTSDLDEIKSLYDAKKDKCTPEEDSFFKRVIEQEERNSYSKALNLLKSK